MTASALKTVPPVGEDASPATGIMAGIRGARWAPPFVMIDRIVEMSRDTAVAETAFNGDAERFTYGSHASPSLLIEAMAQLSLALIRHSDPAVEIGIIPSMREIAMTPPPAGRFDATIHVRWVDGDFPRYLFAGTAMVNGVPVCEAMLDILATREDGR